MKARIGRQLKVHLQRVISAIAFHQQPEGGKHRLARHQVKPGQQSINEKLTQQQAGHQTDGRCLAYYSTDE